MFAFSAFLISYSGGAADIDVKHLDYGCARAEDSIAILKESQELYQRGMKEGETFPETGKEITILLKQLNSKRGIDWLLTKNRILNYNTI